MSTDRLRAMLSEATLPWKINWYENGGVESIDLGESDFISTDGTFYGPNPQNARLIAVAPDAIALLADAMDVLEQIAGPTPTSHRRTVDQLTDAVKWRQGMARDALVRLDALCGDER